MSPNCLFFAQICLYLTVCITMFAGRGARFNSDALRQRAHRLKQRKIGTRQRICFDGLDSNVASRLEQHGQNGGRSCGDQDKPQWTATTIRLRPDLLITFNQSHYLVLVLVT
jgi:hypothetical protein